jgi:hypothetical protein
MALYPFFLDILKYTISGLGIVWIAFYVIKPYLDRDEKIQLLEFKKNITSQTLPLRLQAYERLVLFIERINPANMLLRINNAACSAADLHSLVAEEIRNEYQHNVTQQIYVSLRSWSVVKKIKEDTLALLNNSFRELPATASGLELGKIILTRLAQLEESPYDIAANMLKKDLEGLF